MTVQKRVLGEHLSQEEKQLAVTCFVLSLPCQHFYAMRISFSTFLSLTCLYFLCFLFCAGGRRTRCRCEPAAVVTAGDKPAKTEGRVSVQQGAAGSCRNDLSPHAVNKELCGRRLTRPPSVLLSLVLCSLRSLPSPFSHDALPLTSHLPLDFSPLLASRERSLGWD